MTSWGRVRLRNGRLEVERTDIEDHRPSSPDAVARRLPGGAWEVTEWVPVHYLMDHLPEDQLQAMAALEAGFETDPCTHEEGTCPECQERQSRELAAAFRAAVPWWDDSEAGLRRRARGG